MGPVAALATARVHVLVVAMPGHALLRTRAEAAARRRGWPLVDEPEQADLLVVCGAATRLSGVAAEGLWARVAAPRALRRVEEAGGIEAALDSAARVLGDEQLQRPERPGEPPADAHRAPGTTALGPLARGWPAGLLVTARLEAGRIADARLRLEVVPAEHDPLDADGAQAVLLLDRAAAVLRLAGWAPVARAMEALLDDVLRGRPRAGLLRRARRLRRRVARSAALPLAVRPEVRERLLDALLRAERALWGMSVETRPVDAAAFVAGLIGRSPQEAAQWAAATGRPQLLGGADG